MADEKTNYEAELLAKRRSLTLEEFKDYQGSNKRAFYFKKMRASQHEEIRLLYEGLIADLDAAEEVTALQVAEVDKDLQQAASSIRVENELMTLAALKAGPTRDMKTKAARAAALNATIKFVGAVARGFVTAMTWLVWCITVVIMIITIVMCANLLLLSQTYELVSLPLLLCALSGLVLYATWDHRSKILRLLAPLGTIVLLIGISVLKFSLLLHANENWVAVLIDPEKVVAVSHSKEEKINYPIPFQQRVLWWPKTSEWEPEWETGTFLNGAKGTMTETVTISLKKNAPFEFSFGQDPEVWLNEIKGQLGAVNAAILSRTGPDGLVDLRLTSRELKKCANAWYEITYVNLTFLPDKPIPQVFEE